MAIDKKLTATARTLRRKQTPAERKLWSRLANRQLADAKFRRQQPIGQYVVDFVSLEQKLIIEVDGGHHNDTIDEERTSWLEGKGYRVLRLWNNDVLGNLDGVLHSIAEALGRG